MEVILLERVPKLGQMGQTVKVKDGYARNFLLPLGKALRATKANKERFESERGHLEARNLELRSEAQVIADRLADKSFVIIRQAGETGQLYGSVSARDLADATEANGFTVARSQFVLNTPIKTLGLHPVVVQLHPEVEVKIFANVARSPDEADRQARGENVTARRDEDEDTYENPEDVAIPGVDDVEGEQPAA
ncbi:50S ribosomal protein L9 [Labrys wisconsinensis]|uniref:Large ribosomal subunit protein bL9 n=1 Tax=Labrys wisconsinensis TaxID=425677 RepID=A0ABU0J755_9HYPH|nr:50S ribosomal protein L9 [Labrys wisconsinensis]MDQ0469109.1 large subunit ribosomal protein L9 [Labrys wisconsinensis]